jgi:hypothetical protein
MTNNTKGNGNRKPSVLAEAGRGMAFFSMIAGVFVGLIFVVMGIAAFFSKGNVQMLAEVSTASVDTTGIFMFTFDYNGSSYTLPGNSDTNKSQGDSVYINFPEGKPREAKVGKAPPQAAVGAVAIVIGLVIAGVSYGMYTLTKKSNTLASGYAAMTAISAFSD